MNLFRTNVSAIPILNSMKQIPVICVLGVLFLLGACKKNQLGGKSTIKGLVMHHETVIPNAIVYIKFNAKEFPGKDVTKYDSYFKTGADGSYEFKTYKGDYYLYGVGYDNGISKAVTGGLPVHIRNNETVNADLAITEE